MDPLSDEYLMAQVTQGSRAFLEILVGRYHGPLLGYLYRLTNADRPLAEDLLQETFLRLLRQDLYQADRPFKPWLYSIATHLAYDTFRSPSARLQDPMSEAEFVADWADPAPGPEELSQAASEGESIKAALAELKQEYRAALLLRFYEGLSLQEIAIALEIPLGTVKSRLSVGVQRLGALMKRFEKGDQP